MEETLKEILLEAQALVGEAEQEAEDSELQDKLAMARQALDRALAQL